MVWSQLLLSGLLCNSTSWTRLNSPNCRSIVVRNSLCDQPLFAVLKVSLLQRPFHALGDERRKRSDVRIDAGTIQRTQIIITVLNPDDCPGIPPGGQHRIHQKARHPAVTVGIRM